MAERYIRPKRLLSSLSSRLPDGVPSTDDLELSWRRPSISSHWFHSIWSCRYRPVWLARESGTRMVDVGGV